jgi:hypothetical protein
MTYPGSENPQTGQPAQQPYQGQPPYQQGQPAGAWVPPQGAGAPDQPDRKSGVLKKVVLPVIAVLAVLAIAGVALGLLSGDPEVGDCVSMAGATSFDPVDCASDEAEYKITGIDEQERTKAEWQTAGSDEMCTDVEDTEFVLWIGDSESEPGTVFCAAAV